MGRGIEVTKQLLRAKGLTDREIEKELRHAGGNFNKGTPPNGGRKVRNARN